MSHSLRFLLAGWLTMLATTAWAQAPTITSFSPTSGPAGTVVTVTGTNLAAIRSVVLRGIPCNITPISATQASFRVPAQASTGRFRLTTTGGNVLSSTSLTVTRASASLAYELRSSTFNSINVGSYSTPAVTDLDHDGLIDLLVGREVDGWVSHYEQSAANSTSFTLRSNNLSGLTGHYNSIVSVTDIDGDGLLEMVVGSGAGNFKHYEQSAANSTSFTQLSNDFNNIFSAGGLTFQIPHFTDIDGDGLLDLLVGDEYLSRYEQTAANGGTFTQLANQNFGPTDNSDNGGAAACVVDLDGDGLLDMLVGRNITRVFHHEQASVNSTSFPQVSTAFSGLSISSYSTPAITDLDGDGLLDLLVGGANGGVRHYEQIGTPTITGFTPTSGPVGTSVTVTGTHLAGATAARVNGTTGTITGTPTATSLTFTVGAGSAPGTISVTTPGGTATSAASFTVTRPPTALTLSNTTIAENTGANAVVGTFTTTDPDPGNTFTCTLVSGVGSTDNGLVNISLNQLRITASPNYEAKNSYAIRVRTTDNTGLFFEQTFVITITNVNETPTALALSSNSVAENTGPNAAVGTLSTTDPDAGNTFTYSLVTGTGSTDNGLVNISGDQLRITASPNFESKSSYAVRVRTTDQGGLSTEQPLTITITDVNEAPTTLALSPQSVNENVAANTLVGTLSATDPDAGSTLTYSLVSGAGSADNAAFSISGSQLRINASPDFETKSSYSIRVRVADQGGLFVDQLFTITVNDLVEGPGLSSFSPALGPEGTPVTIVGANLTGTTGVSFNGQAATSFTIVSATQLQAIVPVGATTGLITVTNAGGSEQTSASFEVLPIFSNTFNQCLGTTPITSTGSGAWQYLRAANGQLVAALNDQGHALGQVSLDFYLHQGTIRRDGEGREYFDRNWHLTAQNGFAGQSVLVRLYARTAEFTTFTAANDGDGNDVSAISQLRITQYQGPNEDCLFANNATGAPADYRLLSPAATEALAGANWFALETAVIDHFSEFFLNGGSAPLPVELVAFSATRLTNGSVTMAWRTASERQNAGFVVERSLTGRDFTPVSGLIAGHGTSLQTHAYAWTDEKAPGDMAYYRLRQLDTDGTAAYSQVLTVKPAAGSVEPLRVWPNPATDRVQISGAGPEPVELLDATGRVLRRLTGDGELRLDGVPTGVYLLRCGAQTKKIMING